MNRQGLRNTIASDNNLYWIMAEPIRLHIWVHGIPKAASAVPHNPIHMVKASFCRSGPAASAC